MKRKPHRGRGGSPHIRRTRIATAAILSESLGEDIRPEDIQPATGSYRTCDYHDVYRWELFGRGFIAGCWDTLTDFVRRSRELGGCHINRDNEIHPGPKKD